MSPSLDSSSDDDYVYAVHKKNGDPHTKVTEKVDNVPIKFTVDAGATIDLIDSYTYEQLQHKITLRKSHTKVYSYGSDTPIKLKGPFQVQIESKKQYTVSQVHVANGSGGNLLSAKFGSRFRPYSAGKQNYNVTTRRNRNTAPKAYL